MIGPSTYTRDGLPSAMTTPSTTILFQSYQQRKQQERHQEPTVACNTNSQSWANRMKLILFTLLVLQLLAVAAVSGFEPDFLFPLENVTVAQGRDATFTCVVNNLGGYRVSGEPTTARVAWIKADTKAILAIHEHVITNNARLTVTHNDYNTWTLNIRGVRSEDRGQYMCQVNTDPMKMQIAYLEVVIPPDIIYEETSGDMMVPEGGSAKLVCKARGHPKPRIMWKREDGADIVSRETQTTHGGSGSPNSGSGTSGAGGSTGMNRNRSERFASIESEMLTLHKVTRSEMGAYLCIAGNGVPPSVSKRMMLHVHFHPLIQVPNQLVGAPINTDVTLQCHVEASPKAINYWTRESGEMIISTGNDKYVTNETNSSYYTVHMWLIIKRFQKSDFGGYKCISKNSIGDAEGTIRLYEMEQERIESSLGIADDFSDSEEESGNNHSVDTEENNSLHRNSFQGPLTEPADSGTRPASSEASVAVAVTLVARPFVILVVAGLALTYSNHFVAAI